MNEIKQKADERQRKEEKEEEDVNKYIKKVGGKK